MPHFQSALSAVRKQVTPRAFLLAALSLAGAPALAAQQAEGALLRTFKPGDVQHYRVTLTVRSEVDGNRPATLEGKTYAEPFSDATGGTLTWRVTRSVGSVDGAGTAELEETLEGFSYSNVPTQKDPDGGVGIRAALFGALHSWSEKEKITLYYRETQTGQLNVPSAEAAPELDDAPAVLTLWLRRALRPSASLPRRPAREGERWSEPRAVRLPPWTDVQGTESGEWLAGPPQDSFGRLISLHTVQQISGSIPSPTKEGSAEVPSGSARFHAESLSAVVHAGAPSHGGYGSLVSATRSASREVTHVVPGIPNMKEALFRARISVEIRIQLLE